MKDEQRLRKRQDSLGLVVVGVVRCRFFRFDLLEDLYRPDFAHHLQAPLLSQCEVHRRRKKRGKGKLACSIEYINSRWTHSSSFWIRAMCSGFFGDCAPHVEKTTHLSTFVSVI